MSIIGSLPVTLTNGTLASAPDVMSDFNFIVSQVNANAVANNASGSITGSLTVSGVVTANTQLIGKGTSTNDFAGVGFIGEYIASSVAQGSAVALSTGVAANVTSISLSAGDWNVWATAWYNSSAGASFIECDISPGSATRITPPGSGGVNAMSAAITNTGNFSVTAMTRMSLGTTTTIYLVTYAQFSSGTIGGYGSIQARRMR